MYELWINDRLRKRFWKYVDRSNGQESCWEWLGYKSSGGYGRFGLVVPKRKTVSAHRLVYELEIGPITEGLFVCHKCDNPSCVNPKHLFLGTAKDNMKDAVLKGRIARGDRQGLRQHPERRATGSRHGFYTHPEKRLHGERNGRARLTWDDVRKIRAEYATGTISQTQLAKKYGIRQCQVSEIIRNVSWVEQRSVI